MLSAPQLKSLMEHANTLCLCWGMQKLMGDNLKVVFGTGFHETLCLAVLLIEFTLYTNATGGETLAQVHFY